MVGPFLVSRTELESSGFLNRRASTVLFCWPLALVPLRRGLHLLAVYSRVVLQPSTL